MCLKSLNERKIALALSGGGVRASLFHLGILKHLAQKNLLEQVSFISTVSGGSIVTGLIYSVNNKRWPTSKEYIENVLPQVQSKLQNTNIRNKILLRLFKNPLVLARHGVSGLLQKTLLEDLKIEGILSDIPEEPRWIINSTTYETGKNFRFMSKRMGDYIAGYVLRPKISISTAVAASAGFPGIIGPYIMHTNEYQWSKYLANSQTELEPTQPSFKKLRLWDGGVYDNLGVEALYKTEKHQLREGFDFLLVCDGSAPLNPEEASLFFIRAKRLVDIATSQARNLMARSLFKFFRDNPYSGAYLNIGESPTRISILTNKQLPNNINLTNYLTDSECTALANQRTTLSCYEPLVAEQLIRHGSEVADVALRIHMPDYFKPQSE